MTDPNETEPTIDSFADLPIQPTGSGVADLEIAYEQMKLSDPAGLADDTGPIDAASDAGGGAAIPVETTDDAIESAAHPS